MNIIKQISKNIKFRRQRSKRFESLRHLSDRTLDDIGIDPHMLRMGKSAYPWRSQG